MQCIAKTWSFPRVFLWRKIIRSVSTVRWSVSAHANRNGARLNNLNFLKNCNPARLNIFPLNFWHHLKNKNTLYYGTAQILHLNLNYRNKIKLSAYTRKPTSFKSLICCIQIRYRYFWKFGNYSSSCIQKLSRLLCACK